MQWQKDSMLTNPIKYFNILNVIFVAKIQHLTSKAYAILYYDEKKYIH